MKKTKKYFKQKKNSRRNRLNELIRRSIDRCYMRDSANARQTTEWWLGARVLMLYGSGGTVSCVAACNNNNNNES